MMMTSCCLEIGSTKSTHCSDIDHVTIDDDEYFAGVMKRPVFLISRRDYEVTFGVWSLSVRTPMSRLYRDVG